MPKHLQNDESFQDAVLKSSYGRRGFTGRRQAGPSRMGTAGFKRGSVVTPQTGHRRPSTHSMIPPTTGARPLTAVRGAGFTSTLRPQVPFDPLNQCKLVSSFQEKDESSPEEKIKLLEKKVNSLLEESILASHRQEYKLALEKGKEAAVKDKSLIKQKERLSIERSSSEGISMTSDLTFAVHFNLAIQFSRNELFNEALNSYTTIVKNRSFTNSGIIRVNIGNIYFIQGNFAKAIKFYRMALDQVANTQKDLR